MREGLPSCAPRGWISAVAWWRPLSSPPQGFNRQYTAMREVGTRVDALIAKLEAEQVFAAHCFSRGHAAARALLCLPHVPCLRVVWRLVVSVGPRVTVAGNRHGHPDTKVPSARASPGLMLNRSCVGGAGAVRLTSRIRPAFVSLGFCRLFVPRSLCLSIQGVLEQLESDLEDNRQRVERILTAINHLAEQRPILQARKSVGDS